VRAEAIKRCEELNSLRLEPLGMDRRHNRYWLLTAPDFGAMAGYAGVAGDLEAATKLLGELHVYLSFLGFEHCFESMRAHVCA
jgi:hypothetical protein